MDLEFKNSFVAGAATNTVANATNSTANSLKTTNNDSSGKENSFESTLNSKKNEMNENKNVDRNDKTNNTPKQRDDVKKDVADKKTTDDRAEKTDVVKSRDYRAEAVKEVAATVQEEAAPAPELSPEQSAEVIQQMAEALNVTPEQVTQALEKLDMQPTDLLNNKEGMTKLIMEVKGITDPAELLKMPDLADMMKDLNQMVQSAVEQAKVQTNPVAAQMAETVTEDVPEEAIAQVSTATEEVATVAEDVPEAEGTPRAEETQTIQQPTATNEQASQNAQEQGMGAGAGAERTAEAPEATGADAAEEIQVTPVIMHTGDETVVEVGGRTVSRTAARPQVPATEVLDQIVEKFKVDFKGESTEIKMNLRPNDLGNVAIRLITESGLVTAEIVAENSKVKELIEENIDMLKESLKNQGVNVGELSVSVGQQETSETMQQFLREQQKTKNRVNQILNRITDEEIELAEPENFADESTVSGSSVDFTA